NPPFQEPSYPFRLPGSATLVALLLSLQGSPVSCRPQPGTELGSSSPGPPPPPAQGRAWGAGLSAQRRARARRTSTAFSIHWTETHSVREWKLTPPVNRLGVGSPM